MFVSPVDSGNQAGTFNSHGRQTFRDRPISTMMAELT